MRTNRKIKTYDELRQAAEQLRAQGKKIVFVSGTFDILHAGHAKFLDFAKSHGDVLVVSLGQDSMIRAYKGPDKPVHNEQHRAELIAALEQVDYVTIGREPYDGVTDVTECISLLKPHAYIVPSTDKPDVLARKKQLAQQAGATFFVYAREELSNAPHLSTTAILGHVKKNGF